GLACLTVLLAHLPGFFAPDYGRYFTGTGKYGVWLLFVLSAFLLTNQLQRNGLRLAPVASYAVGRSLRIMPLFWLAILVYWWLGTAGIDSPADVWAAASFRHGYAHLWTIPVEFTFYALLPI